MNRSALFLVIFSIVFLLIFGITYGRSKRWVVPGGEAPDVTRARRRSNRIVLALVAVTVLASWIGAAAIALGGFQITQISIDMAFTSILIGCWLIAVISSTLRVRELSKKLELAGGADKDLLKAIEAVKGARLKFAVLFGIMAGISLVNLIENLTS